MKSLSKNITGDPFIDLGGLVFQTLKERFPEKTDLEQVKFMVDVYIKNWQQKLH